MGLVGSSDSQHYKHLECDRVMVTNGIILSHDTDNLRPQADACDVWSKLIPTLDSKKRKVTPLGVIEGASRPRGSPRLLS